MKPSCSIEQGGVTQPHSGGNITGPIANILYGEVVKKKRDPILPPIGSNIGTLFFTTFLYSILAIGLVILP